MSEPVKLERILGHFAKPRARKTLCGRPAKNPGAYQGVVGAPSPCVPCVSKAGKLLTPKQRKVSTLEIAFNAEAKRRGFEPGMVAEFAFGAEVGRGWRFDFAWPNRTESGNVARGGVAVELDGGIFLAKGRSHGWGTGREDDAVRDAAATILGWRVFRVTPNILRHGCIWEWLGNALNRATGPVREGITEARERMYSGWNMYPKGRELRPPKMRANPQARRNEARA